MEEDELRKLREYAVWLDGEINGHRSLADHDSMSGGVAHDMIANKLEEVKERFYVLFPDLRK